MPGEIVINSPHFQLTRLAGWAAPAMGTDVGGGRQPDGMSSVISLTIAGVGCHKRLCTLTLHSPCLPWRGEQIRIDAGELNGAVKVN